MTMDADLSEKLEDARATLANLAMRLGKHDSLAESLTNANRQLGQAAADTSGLVRSAHATQESLAQSLERIQSVMDVLNRLDPAPVLSSLESAQTSINNIAALVQEQSEALREAITSSSQATQQHLETVTSAISIQQARNARFLRIVGVITLLAATTAAVISIITVASP